MLQNYYSIYLILLVARQIYLRSAYLNSLGMDSAEDTHFQLLSWMPKLGRYCTTQIKEEAKVQGKISPWYHCVHNRQ